MVQSKSRTKANRSKAGGEKNCGSQKAKEGFECESMHGVRCEACHAEMLELRSRKEDERIKKNEKQFLQLKIEIVKAELMLGQLRLLFAPGERRDDVQDIASALRHERKKYEQGLRNPAR
jgi:hypothetical protein